MELWVRSQDRESLLMIKKVFYHCTCNEMESLGEHYIGNKEWVGDKDYTLLGKYKTKERALEVLDEIHQRLIDLQTLEITPDFYKVCKRNLDNVYEMPKE